MALPLCTRRRRVSTVRGYYSKIPKKYSAKMLKAIKRSGLRDNQYITEHLELIGKRCSLCGKPPDSGSYK